ncbi:MAG: ABC transporter permease [Balneolaceae bacterium]|nr:ABC transporter permease [Balneolaceae bacterium]
MDFSKVFLVLKREYLTRVRTKSFILSTLLTPLAFIVFMGIMIYVSISEGEVTRTVAVIDQTEAVYNELEELDPARYFDASAIPLDSIRAQVLDGDVDGYIILTEENINYTERPTLVYGGAGGISFIESVESDVRRVLREERLARSNVSEEVREIFEARYNIDSLKLTEQGEEEDNAVLGAVFGFILGLLIFIGVFGYGAVLMRSVIEEKTNRIVEVIASSVKPIELMTGKLLGICVLALTQFGIWIASYIGLSMAAAPVATMFVDAQVSNLPPEAVEASASFDPSKLEMFIFDPSIFAYFFVFFIIGFLIYAGIFAAIGAAVDSEQDTQQFMMPVMIPIFIAYFLNLKVMEDPDSTIAVVASLFPLTAPINMISRIAATEVPAIQIIASLLLMIVTFVGLMWVAAKIYRVGILMYGKKPSYKELAKWIRQS